MYFCTLRGQWIPLTAVIDSWESTCSCCELNSWPLEQQPLLLTVEAFLQLLTSYILRPAFHFISIFSLFFDVDTTSIRNTHSAPPTYMKWSYFIMEVYNTISPLWSYATKYNLPKSEMRNIFLSCWPMIPINFPNIVSYCQCYWLSFITLWQNPIGEGITYLSHTMQRHLDGSQMRNSFLLASIHSPWGCYENHQRRKLVINITQVWIISRDILKTDCCCGLLISTDAIVTWML